MNVLIQSLLNVPVLEILTLPLNSCQRGHSSVLTVLIHVDVRVTSSYVWPQETSYMILEKLILTEMTKIFFFKNYGLSLSLTSSIVQWPYKLTVSQLVKRLTTSYEYQRFITLPTTAHLMILSYTTWKLSISYYVVFFLLGESTLSEIMCWHFRIPRLFHLHRWRKLVE